MEIRFGPTAVDWQLLPDPPGSAPSQTTLPLNPALTAPALDSSSSTCGGSNPSGTHAETASGSPLLQALRSPGLLQPPVAPSSTSPSITRPRSKKKPSSRKSHRQRLSLGSGEDQMPTSEDFDSPRSREFRHSLQCLHARTSLLLVLRLAHLGFDCRCFWCLAIFFD